MDRAAGGLTGPESVDPHGEPVANGADTTVPLLGRCAFPLAGTAVDCAVSGGPDSTALLVLAVAAGLEVTCWTVDHGLRSTSADEARLVTHNAAALGVSTITVDGLVVDGPNLEQRARDTRRAVLPMGVLTGHTADDQAETVLLNLLRGAGVPGTAGIGEPARRPLLALRRAETRALCAALGLEVVDDPSNADPRFTRNRVRHEVLPLLSDVAGRDPVPLLARHATLAGEATSLLDGLVVDVDPADVRSVADLPDDMVRLAVRRWLTSQITGQLTGTMAGYPTSPPPDQASIDRVLDVVRGRVVATEVAGGHRVRRSAGFLVFEPR